MVAIEAIAEIVEIADLLAVVVVDSVGARAKGIFLK
jgi:hypothetical protein